MVALTLNGAGIRDTTRVLGVSINTVLKTLRQAAAQLDSQPLPERVTEPELDELWSFVGSKQDQRWIGKLWTQRIERHNLNFRTHLKRLHRKTICFSKTERMHDAVIKLYVNYINQAQHHF